MTTHPSGAASQNSVARRPRPWLAALLSLFQPGLGQLYVWRPSLALVALLVSIFGLLAAVESLLHVPGLLGFTIAMLLLLGTAIGIAWHAWRLARHNPAARRPRRLPLLAALAGWTLGGMLILGEVRDRVKRDLVEAFSIPSGAMEPTILAGDFLFVAKRRGPPAARDRMAVYKSDRTTLLKRVVGLGGDTLSMRDGRLVRNGHVVSEPYARTDSERAGPSTDFDWQRSALVATRDSASYDASVDDWGPLVVPAGQLFVLGDNRHNSLDSRYTGFVASDSVLGAPVSVYFSRDPNTGTVRWNRIGRGLE